MQHSRTTRRAVLSAVGAGLGAGVIGTTAVGQEEPGTGEQSAAEQGASTTYALVQGDQCVPVEPLRADQPVETIYGYNVPEEYASEENGAVDIDGPSYTSVGTAVLQRPQTSIMFLYQGPERLSLVIVHGQTVEDQDSQTTAQGNQTGGQVANQSSGQATNQIGGQSDQTGGQQGTQTTGQQGNQTGGQQGNQTDGGQGAQTSGPQGGAASFTIFGLPTDGDWIVRDDYFVDPQTGEEAEESYDNWASEGEYHRVDWTWGAGRTDGGAYGDLGQEFQIVIRPAFNEQAALFDEYYEGTVTDWEFVSGPRGQDRVSLAMDESIGLATGSCDELLSSDAVGNQTENGSATGNRTTGNRTE